MPKLRPFVSPSNGSEPFDAKGGNDHSEPNDIDCQTGLFYAISTSQKEGTGKGKREKKIKRETERESERERHTRTTQGKEKLSFPTWPTEYEVHCRIGNEANPIPSFPRAYGVSLVYPMLLIPCLTSVPAASKGSSQGNEKILLLLRTLDYATVVS